MTWREWIALIEWGVFAAIPIVMAIRWMIRDHRDLFKREIPGQLVQLIKQAHGMSELETTFDIRVSPEMRDALCAPLTQEQLAVIRAAQKDVYSTYVKCELLSSTFKGPELSGVVKVAVRVSSKFSEFPLVCAETKLRIVVRHNGRQYPNGEWVVTSVEQVI